ncbi:MAG: CarboxypepD reg-like domain [Acidobacteriota bacterium]|jgi:hypothetical protein|nr:CarboxypepD reg-like domain [Acidobacteriota bacterium]
MRIFVLALFVCVALAVCGADVVPLREGVPCVGVGDRVTTADAACMGRTDSGAAPYLLRAAGVTAAARFREGRRPSPESMRDVTFSVTGEGKRWPAPATIELSDANAATWQWGLAATQVRRKQVLRLLPGDYRLTFSAPGHQRLERSVKVASGEPRIDLGTVVLAAARTVSGSVIDPERRPVAGCAVLADGVALGFTDARGRFGAELPLPAPRSVVLSHPAFAPRVVPLAAEGDAPLGVVRLARGGSIACTIDRQKIGMEAKISATLFEYVAGDMFRRRDSASLDAEETLISFTGLDPGDYGIRLEGAGPGEQMVVPVTVSDGAVSDMLVTIAPWRLELTVLHGDEPLGDGTVRLLTSGVLERRVWYPEIRLDAAGAATLDLWQRGVIFAEVRSPQLRSAFGPDPFITPTDERAGWNIVVPRQRVHGVVVDDATGEPVEGAHVIHDSEVIGGERRPTDREGRFAFDALHDGRHTFRVDSRSHLPVAPVSVDVMGPSGDQRLDFRLKKGKTIPLQVRDADGRPVAAALVIDNCPAAVGRRGFRTDESGMLALPSGGGRHSLCVVALQGSFALTDVASPDDKQTAMPPAAVQITVPAPAVAMRIAAKTTSGLPVAQLGLLLVYNGRVVPLPVLHALAELQRRSTRTDDRGELLLAGMPAGHYDLFVYTTDEEAFSLATDRRGIAPVYSGYLAPGDAALEVTIEAR